MLLALASFVARQGYDWCAVAVTPGERSDYLLLGVGVWRVVQTPIADDVAPAAAIATRCQLDATKRAGAGEQVGTMLLERRSQQRHGTTRSIDAELAISLGEPNVERER